ncbi:MAG TPA: HAMP domain-containing protein, partial [Planctomycetaceae bacterium]|nr:HAMP domain-containing protein [Planctomycetaceae bacterium]
LLAVATFVLYWWRTSELIDAQNRTTARLMISPIVLEKHWTWSESESEFIEIIRRLPAELQPEDLKDYKWELYKAYPTAADAEHRPMDQLGYEALETIRQGASEVVKKVPDRNEYQYYGAVYATSLCIDCHYHATRTTADGQTVKVKAGELIGMAKITLPLARTEETLHSTNAFVMTAEFIKIVLAILAVYLVIRYVITKPVLHLKKVSDAIAHGNLDMRADIRTGDEFEELSHAFNRMLRHLVTVQEELRELNADLDAKVDELAQVNLKLYEMNKLKNEFLATMSHELRTPLNSILGFSDVLANADNLTERQKRYVANIATAGRTLLAMINDVLDLAKIEAGKMELQVVEFSVRDLIERQAAAMAPIAEKKNIELTWRVEEDVPTLKQDAGKLQQILNNLLSNAIKFVGPGVGVQRP